MFEYLLKIAKTTKQINHGQISMTTNSYELNSQISQFTNL